ncbi:threonine/serine exporter family protein [Romboutsia sp. 1001713B170131_170501_G6]|uniref:threonine/serine exporter family protein n=1 Tax=Romboutsia sp. 1001713B170131_170501_G6 TaxID=2787108 RepID=UPI0018AC3EED|nr:threonine/serine exporter family protein [Romboutsia sp. 1001713B170131_170501_G6]
MTDMSLIWHFIFSAFSTVGFAVFLNGPISTLIPAGITGGIGWTMYYYLMGITSNSIISNFIATLVVSFISEMLARKLKHPAILFVIPGIIPLVPGLGMYNTMLYLVQKDYDMAVSVGTDVLFSGAAIALGILVMTSFVRTINIFKLKKMAALLQKVSK